MPTIRLNKRVTLFGLAAVAGLALALGVIMSQQGSAAGDDRAITDLSEVEARLAETRGIEFESARELGDEGRRQEALAALSEQFPFGSGDLDQVYVVTLHEIEGESSFTGELSRPLFEDEVLAIVLSEGMPMSPEPGDDAAPREAVEMDETYGIAFLEMEDLGLIWAMGGGTPGE